MADETVSDKVGRVRAMAGDDTGTWDLSPNDVAALVEVLRQRDEALEALRHLEIVTRRSGRISDDEMAELEQRHAGGDCNVPWGEIDQSVREAATAAIAKAEGQS